MPVNQCSTQIYENEQIISAPSNHDRKKRENKKSTTSERPSVRNIIRAPAGGIRGSGTFIGIK